jgi:hypothetical protein
MPRISHVPIASTWVFILIATGIGASPAQGQRPVATKPADETFVVSGTLVRDDKTPIDGARVMIAEAKDTGYAISIGEGGVLQNPGEMTDAKGRFSIAVKRSLFKERQEFVVVVPFFDGTAQPMRLADGVVTFKIDRTTKEYKLGKIARDNPAVR